MSWQSMYYLSDTILILVGVKLYAYYEYVIIDVIYYDKFQFKEN